MGYGVRNTGSRSDARIIKHKVGPKTQCLVQIYNREPVSLVVVRHLHGVASGLRCVKISMCGTCTQNHAHAPWSPSFLSQRRGNARLRVHRPFEFCACNHIHIQALASQEVGFGTGRRMGYVSEKVKK